MDIQADTSGLFDSVQSGPIQGMGEEWMSYAPDPPVLDDGRTASWLSDIPPYISFPIVNAEARNQVLYDARLMGEAHIEYPLLPV